MPLVNDRFIRADGAPGTAPTGQTWSAAGDPLPVIASGVLRSAATGEGYSYAQADLGVTPTRIAATVTFDSGTGNGNGLAVICSPQNLGLTTMLHFIASPATWALQIREDGGDFTEYASGSFPSSLTADGSTEHTFTFTIDGDTITGALPSSEAFAVTDAAVGRCKGRYVVWEPSRVAGAKNPAFTRCEAAAPRTTGVLTPD